MAVYASGATLTPAHGTNGHCGRLVDPSTVTWRCTRCHAVAVGDDAWRTLVAAGWCAGALAALPAPHDIDVDDKDLADDPVEPMSVLDAVAHVVRHVFPIWAAASADPIGRSGQCGGRMYGWRYEAMSPRGKVTLNGDNLAFVWPRKAMCEAITSTTTDPEIAVGFDCWRALSLELSRLAGRTSWTDPVRAAEIERERSELRSDVEARYSVAAAQILLGHRVDPDPSAEPAPPAGQLSLFDAAS